MALFENARPVSEIDREGFARDVRKLMNDAFFQGRGHKGPIHPQHPGSPRRRRTSAKVNWQDVGARVACGAARREERGKRKEEREELLSC